MLFMRYGFLLSHLYSIEYNRRVLRWPVWVLTLWELVSQRWKKLISFCKFWVEVLWYGLCQHVEIATSEGTRHVKGWFAKAWPDYNILKREAVGREREGVRNRLILETKAYHHAGPLAKITTIGARNILSNTP